MCDEGHTDIIDRLEDLEKAFREYNGELKDIRRDTSEIRTFLIGDLNKDKDKPGLAERVRRIEEWIDGQKKMYYLVVSVFITQIIGWIFTFLLLQK